VTIMPLTIQTAAPDFSAVDQNGTTRTLADYKGKWLLLYFYPKDFTPGCTTEACQLRDYFAELTSKVSIVGISTDSTASHAKFSKKYELPFTLLADPDKKMINRYGVNGIVFSKRTSFLIDPFGRIAKIYTRVKPETHAAEILADMADFAKT
jgi:thioredoxin-dependent peroxiredoxin